MFSSFNGMVWTDVKVGTDTIRVINVHLQSMGIRVRRVLTKKEMADVKAETRTVLGALKGGFTARKREIRIVEAQIDQSPYPVIVTGDFNDTPYSVVYQRLHRRLPNAFEKAGHGFGFTLNRAPRTIRIDNQFYDPRFQVIDFLTHRNLTYSDHFPIEGRYTLPKQK
jgi:endonuclease/exonuclease/phosphatase (EEP) superfamily protein YafD